VKDYKASAVCQEAATLVSGDRERTHGDKMQNHLNIATLWTAYLGVPVTPHQAAMMMVLLKVARTKLGSLNRDDYVDMAGYAGVAAEIADKADFAYRALAMTPPREDDGA
jgi:hypothetical protein